MSARGSTYSPAIMETPSIHQLQHQAKFEIGDEVYYMSGQVWRIVARYWSHRNQRIEYDIERAGQKRREGEKFLFPVRPRG